MKNNNKITILLLVGAAVAGLAGWFLTRDYINNEVTAYQSSFEQERRAVAIVVAARDLQVGEVINTQTAQIRQIPAAYVHNGAVAPEYFSSKLQGRPLVHPVRAGEPILTVHVTNVKINGLSSLLKDGERALTIAVDSLNALSGFINPGDNIDLYITLKDGERDRTVPLVENVRVLATGIDIDDGLKEAGQNRFTELTLGVTPLDASKILHGQTVGDLSVLLRKADDKSSQFQDYITIDNLVDIPQQASPKIQQPVQWGFEIIKGGRKS